MRLLFPLALVVLLSAPGPLLAQSEGKKLSKEDEARYADLVEKAKAYYKVQEYDSALSLYKEAYVLSLAPVLLYNVGQCYRQLGRYEEALKSYRQFLKDDPKTKLKSTVEELIAEVEEALSTKTIEPFRPPTMDPTPAVDPPATEPALGTAATAPASQEEPARGTAATEPATQGALPEGMITEPSATQEAPGSRLSGRVKLLYGAAVVTSVAALVFGGFGLSSLRQGQALAEQELFIGGAESEGLLTRATRLGITADVLFVSGLASGTFGYLLSRREKRAGGAGEE